MDTFLRYPSVPVNRTLVKPRETHLLVGFTPLTVIQGPHAYGLCDVFQVAVGRQGWSCIGLLYLWSVCICRLFALISRTFWIGVWVVFGFHFCPLSALM